MSERKRVFVLILIMGVIVTSVIGIALIGLYQVTFDQQRERLVETAKSQARLIEAVARFDAIYSTTDVPGGAVAATLGQVREAHEQFKGFGKSGEFTLAKLEAGQIVFQLRHRRFDMDNPKPVPFSSKLAEPMRRALSGKSGTVIGLDYRGERVLAAYEPVRVLNMGIVAKIDLAEVRGPFIKMGLVAGAAAVALIFIGAMLFLRISRPMIKRLEVQTEELAEEVAERKLVEQAVRKLNEELDERVNNRTAELAASNKELEAFSYSLSHDLRAPLRAINGYSQAVLEDYADKLDEQGKHYLQRLRAGSQRMGQQIDDMLALARVTRGEFRRDTVNLSEITQTIVRDLRSREPDRQVDFVIAEGIVANGDKTLLRVLFENLLGNAWKFTNNHPRALIEFGVTQVDGKPAYFVKDDGVGFDMAYADKLFAPFQRLHAVTEFEGTGIGLATVQRVIDRHAGRIWAEGEVEGGAIFYFTL